MCEWGNYKTVYVIRRNHPDLPDGWYPVAVDACIADYVQEMNDKGIITVGCCCGHGKNIAHIEIAFNAENEILLSKYRYDYFPAEMFYTDRSEILLCHIVGKYTAEQKAKLIQEFTRVV